MFIFTKKISNKSKNIMSNSNVFENIFLEIHLPKELI